jgi:hypothetical protein
MRSQTLGALVLVSIATQCWSQPQKGFLTGNDIYSFCQHDRSAALGYTAGLWDEAVHGTFVLDETRAPGPQGEALVKLGNKLLTGFCPPTDAILDQVTDVFCSFLRDTAQERHEPAPILFNKALKKAWPCQAR